MVDWESDYYRSLWILLALYCTSSSVTIVLHGVCLYAWERQYYYY
jgi:hypothetical protein